MRAWLTRPFVLYPRGRRLLWRLLTYYIAATLLPTLYWWPFASTNGEFIAMIVTITNVVGAMLSVHMLVLGMVPADGMSEPTSSDQGHIKAYAWMKIWRFPRLYFWNLKLYGDERRLILALAPLVLSVVWAMVLAVVFFAFLLLGV